MSHCPAPTIWSRCVHAAAARKQEIMCEPLDSLNTPVEESGETIPPPMLPMMNPTTDGTPERRSLLDRLLKRSAGRFNSKGRPRTVIQIGPGQIHAAVLVVDACSQC